MLVRRRLARTLWAVGLAGAALPSCGRLGFDLRADGEGAGAGGDGSSGGGAAGPVSLDAGMGGTGSGGQRPSSGGATGGASRGGGWGGDVLDASAGSAGSRPDASASGGGSSGGTSAGGSATGGRLAAGGGSGGIPIDAALDGRTDGGTSPVPCVSSSPVRTWSFDSTVDGWTFTPNVGAGSVSWTGATGNPTSGALSLDVTRGNGLVGWVMLYQTSTDLRGQVASAWVYQDSGAAVGLKLFAQTTTYDWADGGFVALSPRTWTCLSLDFDAPVYSTAAFDAADVTRYGLEVGGRAPVRLYVDQLAY